MVHQREQPIRDSEEREAAIRDVERRTLASIEGRLSKLVYLSSMRDFNTGQYTHEGLAFRFGAGAAGEALHHWHGAIFEELLVCPLRALVSEIEAYAEANRLPFSAVLDAWEGLEPYRILAPQSCDRLSQELFIADFKTGLAILRQSQAARSGNPPDASRPR